MTAPLPNLFVVGAMKAGTSSLHEYLHQHPDIYMSRMKEPQYFAPHHTRWGQAWGQGNPFPEPTIDWYLRLFSDAGNAAYVGESSVSYTARPWVEGCAERIHRFNPEARIIYLVRDPVERVISHYWHFVKDGREDLGLLSAVRKRTDYVARSDYMMQLQPFVDVFGAEQVHVLALEELLDVPQATFQTLFHWLDIDRNIEIDIETQHNVGTARMKQTRPGLVFLDTALKHWRWRPWFDRLPSLGQTLIERIVYRDVDRRRVDTQLTIEYLRPLLRPKTEHLFETIGRDFRRQWTTLFPSSHTEPLLAS